MEPNEENQMAMKIASIYITAQNSLGKTEEEIAILKGSYYKFS